MGWIAPRNRSFARSGLSGFRAILKPMNSITYTINGLASSLLLNVGLSQMAQKLDPVSQSKPQVMAQAISAEYCAPPCSFQNGTGQ